MASKKKAKKECKNTHEEDASIFFYPCAVYFIEKTEMDSKTQLIVGGGVIDTFSFGVKEIDKEESYKGGENMGGTLASNELFYLEDAVGASSAGYVAQLENTPVYHPIKLEPHEENPIRFEDKVCRRCSRK